MSVRPIDVSYALMRVIIGVLFLCHGVQKIFGALGARSMATDPLIVTAGWIELTAGTCIALGLLTRVMAFLASGEMAVAYFHDHAPLGFWPIMNMGELAVAYCFVFLYLSLQGPGLLSLDHLLWSRWTSRRV